MHQWYPLILGGKITPPRKEEMWQWGAAAVQAISTLWDLLNTISAPDIYWALSPNQVSGHKYPATKYPNVSLVVRLPGGSNELTSSVGAQTGERWLAEDKIRHCGRGPTEQDPISHTFCPECFHSPCQYLIYQALLNIWCLNLSHSLFYTQSINLFK